MYMRWKDKSSGKYVVVQFDACTRESVESALSITTHPIEEGADITDHAHEGPDKITLEGYVSNKPLPSNPNVYEPTDPIAKTSALQWMSHPLSMPDVDTKVFGEQEPTLLDNIKGGLSAVSPGGLTKAVTGAINNLLNPPPTDYHAFIGVDGFSDRAKDVYIRLRKAQSERARIEVGIKMVTLYDMLLAKMSTPRTVKEGNGAAFTLELQRIRVVKSATVDAPQPAEARGKPEQPTGPKAPEDDPKKKQPPVSLARQGHLALKKLF